MEDPYLRERGFDIENVGKRILQNLLGFEDEAPKRFAEKTIVIASSISPGELINLRQENLKGIIVSKGGAASHVSVLQGHSRCRWSLFPGRSSAKYRRMIC